MIITLNIGADERESGRVKNRKRAATRAVARESEREREREREREKPLQPIGSQFLLPDGIVLFDILAMCLAARHQYRVVLALRTNIAQHYSPSKTSAARNEPKEGNCA